MTPTTDLSASRDVYAQASGIMNQLARAYGGSFAPEPIRARTFAEWQRLEALCRDARRKMRAG